MSAALTDLVSTVTGKRTRASRAAENVLSLKVDEALFDKVKRRERTRCVRPNNKYWNDHLDGVVYTHIRLFTNSSRSMRVAWKGCEKRKIPIAPDRRVTMWEIYL